jgi:glycosyltransferase involved in cell wall biosynthesis
LLLQTIRNYEVIVVDDGSTDGTTSILQEYTDKLRIYHNETRRGPAFSRNRGIQESRGELIAITDSDCIAAKNWLERLIKPLDDDMRVMIVGGKVNDPPAKNYWERVNNASNLIAKQSRYVKSVIGCNMAFRKTFWEMEKFDEALLYPAAEDYDLCLRCAKRGFKVYFEHSADVIHYHRSSLQQTFWQHFRYGFFNAQVSLKNREVMFFWPYFLAGLMAIIALSQHAFSWMAGLFFLFTGYILVCLFLNFQRRNSWRETLVTYPGFILLSVSHSLGKISYFLTPGRAK